jgi:hypothetical protein
MKRVIIAVAVAVAALFTITACSDDATVASENISKDADNFKVNRRIVFFNGITDKYLLEIQGFCNIHQEEAQLEVTCKLGEDQFKKHFLGLSDNVSYFVEQIKSANVSTQHYKVTFKPSEILPDIEAR